MRYETLKKRAWSHRGVVAAAMVVIVATTALASAPPAAGQDELYSLRYKVTPGDVSTLFSIEVIDNATSTALKPVRVRTHGNQPATIELEHMGRTISVQARMNGNGSAHFLLVVTTPTEKLQRTLYTWQPLSDRMDDQGNEFTGQPITLNLKDAQLKDVLKTFGEITNMRVVIAPGVDGVVTIQVTDVPWDQALDIIARQNGLKITAEKGAIRVTK